MKGWITLADFAEVHAGKLFIVGGGIYLVGPGPVSMGVAAEVLVPWEDRSKRLDLRLALMDGNGRPFMAPTSVGVVQAPLEVGARFEVVPSPGTPAGAQLPFAFAFYMANVPLPPDTYEWHLFIEREDAPAARKAFTVRSAAPQTATQ